MKIVIFTDTMDRKAMGTALYTRKLVENLLTIKPAGTEIFLVHREKNDDLLYQKTNEMILPKVRLPKFGRFFSEAFFLWKTRQDFDIIHYPQESNYPLFWLSRAKIAITVHSAVEGWREFGGLKRRWWLICWTFKFFQKRIAAIISVSQSTQKSFRDFFRIPDDKIYVTYEAADEGFFKARDKTAAAEKMSELYKIPFPYILNGGRIDPHKNAYRLIEAYAILKKENKIPHYLVIGGRHLPAENKLVEKLIKKTGLEKEIIFKPYIEERDLPDLYAAADLFVFPSLHEGFGLPILEAMAAGVPVITSNVFAMPEIAGGAAILLNPYDVKEIAAAMRKVLSDAVLVSQMVEKGRRRAREFSWEKTAKETLAVYRAISTIF